ncbi:MAG TPA: hypothetical protein DIS79_05130 [Bacteroidetes bacterium]|nr:hypothetical protein [Bacteroidota bacterium]
MPYIHNDSMSPLCALPALLISEIYATPAAGEPEWVELVTTRPVSAGVYVVCDNRTCTSFEITQSLPESTFVVITRDTLALRESRPIPSSAVLLEARIPSLNNTTDAVRLYRLSSSGDTTGIDSVEYSIPSSGRGRSFERTDSGLWQTSLSADSATCGYLNSVVLLQHDVRVAQILPADRSLSVDVLQHGMQRSPPRKLTLEVRSSSRTYSRVVDVPSLATVADVAQRLFRTTVSIDEVASALAITTPTNVTVEACLNEGDDRTANDTIRQQQILPPPPGTIVISEIMFDTDEDRPDYVEILNTTSEFVDVSSWTVRSTTIRALVLPPNGYGVVAADSSLLTLLSPSDRVRWSLTSPRLSLPNSSDTITLRTPSGYVVDVAIYDTRYHDALLERSRNVSLERQGPTWLGTDPRSWKTSADFRGGTPGTGTAQSPPMDGQLSVSPTPCSGSPYDVRFPCQITWSVPLQRCIVGLKIVDLAGRPIRTLVNSEWSGAEATVAWDCTDDGGLRVASGRYVAIVEAIDATSTSVIRETAVVYVGE